MGVVFDLSARREPTNDVVRGIEFAAAKLRRQGIEIQLETFDSKSYGLGTREAMLTMLKSHSDLIIPEVDSSKAVIVAEIDEKGRRVMITPYATSPIVTAGLKYVFRTCFSDDFQGMRLAEFAVHELKRGTAALIIDSEKHGAKVPAA